MKLIATQMNDARTNSAAQPAVALPAWGDDASDRLGYDGAGRMITKRYLTGGIDGSSYGYVDTTALVGFTASFDRASNKLYERHLHAEERSHLYQPFNADGSFAMGYDSANRLRQYQRGVLSSTIIPYRVPAGGSVATPITLPDADQVRTYGLDGLGNWKTTNYTEVGSGGSTTSTAEVRSHNTVNEITAVTDTIGSGSPTTTGFTYLANGVLASDGVRQYVYDWNNRLIQVNNAAGTPLATYVYDYLGRRIQKTINDLDDTGFGGLTGDIPAGVTDYLYAGQQLIEQCNDASPGVWTQVNFWGQYIDELLFFSTPAPATYRVLSDLLYRSVAMVTTANVVTEAYDTDAYGNTLCYSGPGTDGLWFTDDDVQTNNSVNTTIFTGRQYDPESQIYWYRARYYSPQIGRFISRDYLKNAELSQGANLYWYVQDASINKIDPSGLFTCDQLCKELAILNSGIKSDTQLANGQHPAVRAEGTAGTKQGNPVTQQLENNAEGFADVFAELFYTISSDVTANVIAFLTGESQGNALTYWAQAEAARNGLFKKEVQQMLNSQRCCCGQTLPAALNDLPTIV